MISVMKQLAGFAAVRHERRVLLVRQAYDKMLWGFPGGAIEMGETVAEGTRREVLEETALAVELDALLSYWERPDLALFVFLATPLTLDVSPRAEEIADVGWFDAGGIETLSPCFSTHRALALHALLGASGLRSSTVTNYDGKAISMWSGM